MEQNIIQFKIVIFFIFKANLAMDLQGVYQVQLDYVLPVRFISIPASFKKAKDITRQIFQNQSRISWTIEMEGLRNSHFVVLPNYFDHQHVILHKQGITATVIRKSFYGVMNNFSANVWYK